MKLKVIVIIALGIFCCSFHFNRDKVKVFAALDYAFLQQDEHIAMINLWEHINPKDTFNFIKNNKKIIKKTLRKFPFFINGEFPLKNMTSHYYKENIDIPNRKKLLKKIMQDHKYDAYNIFLALREADFKIIHIQAFRKVNNTYYIDYHPNEDMSCYTMKLIFDIDQRGKFRILSESRGLFLIPEKE